MNPPSTQQEIKTIETMIALYCHSHHHTKKELCPTCKDLFDYACRRIERCPFKETKTFCSECSVHCYQPALREQVRTVMCFSGPRMIFHHPLLAFKHLIATHKKASLPKA